MQDLQKIVIEVLKKDDRFVSQEGDLLKNTIREQAEKLDENLIGLLLDNEKTREVFFIKIKDVIVFDVTKFIRFVNNKEFLPDSYTSFKNKIGLTNARGEFLSESNEVVLSFPYKDGVLAGGQDKEDSKRDEIFYNEILGSDDIDRLLDEKVFTNAKRIDKDGEHSIDEFTRDESGTIRDNLIIKGNNLLALHSLKSNFAGKVKLIYIDPPYNTGNDGFKYNDKFNHSTWLTFMKNRLDVSKQLLKDEGVIFVQCDNKEVHYLKLLMDEIFDRKNYKNALITKKGTKNVQSQFETVVSLNAGYDTILFYSKEDIRIPNLFNKLTELKKGSWNNHWRGTDRPTMRYDIFGIVPETGQWRWEESRSNKAIANYKILAKYCSSKNLDIQKLEDVEFDSIYTKFLEENGLVSSEFALLRLSRNNKPEHYIAQTDENLLNENWMDISVRGGVTDFEHEKNERILERIFNWLTEPLDIVLDYHLGSGTTSAVAHKMQRQYIGIEQMDYLNTISIPRLKKVIDGEQEGVSKNVEWKGGGNFVYLELKKSNQEYIDKIQNSEKSGELIRIYDEIKESGFLNYNIDIKSIDANIDEFGKLTIGDQKKFLIELLDKNMLYVNMSEIDDIKNGVSDEEKNINRDFYNVK